MEIAILRVFSPLAGEKTRELEGQSGAVAQKTRDAAEDRREQRISLPLCGHLLMMPSRNDRQTPHKMRLTH